MVEIRKIEPPTDEAELLRRARALAGHPLGLIAQRCGVPLADTSRAKGWTGQLLETALGATAANRAAPDFEALGVELKTVPVRPDGRPRESTFVCTVPLETLAEVPWESSRVRSKLARVLWVPVESDPEVPAPLRRVGMPLLWSPLPDEEEGLRRDWREFAELVGRGLTETITAHLGQHLQIRPKAANAKVLGWGLDEDGAPVRVPPRGFYLRATFVGSILRRHYALG